MNKMFLKITVNNRIFFFQLKDIYKEVVIKCEEKYE